MKKWSRTKVGEETLRSRPSFAYAVVFLVVLGVTAHLSGISEATAAEQKKLEPYKVAAIYSTTGFTAVAGSEMLSGAQLLVDNVNKSGGINGHPLELIHYDPEAKAENVTSQGKKAVQRDKVLAMIGPESITFAAALSAVANEAKIVMIHGGGAYGPMSAYEFSSFPVIGLHNATGLFLKKKGISAVGVIAQAGPIAEEHLRNLVPAFEKANVKIVGFEQVQATDRDMTPILAKLRAAGSQAIYSGALGAPGAVVAKNFKQLGMPGFLMTFIGNANMAFVDLLGDAADVTYIMGNKVLAYEDLPSNDPAKNRLVAFAKDYKAKFKKEPSVTVAVGYDALLPIVEALKVVGPDSNKIRDKIETGQPGLVGINGAVSRSATEHNGLAPDFVPVMIDVAKKRFRLAN